MTKTQTALISVIVLLAIIFLISVQYWSGINQPLPKVSLRFVGFGNNPYGISEIRFSITNYSQRVTWEVAKMSKETSNGWETVEPPTDYINYATNPLPSSFEIGMPISQTNVTWRLVFRINEKATGLSGLIDSSKEIFSKLSGTPEELYMGRIYFVTNETSNIH